MSFYFGFKAEKSLREIVAAKPLVVVLELQDLRIFGAIQWSCEAEGDNSGKNDEKLHDEMIMKDARGCVDLRLRTKLVKLNLRTRLLYPRK